MFGVDAGALAKIATALIHGDENIIERLVESKIESIGQQLIEQALDRILIGEAFGAIHRTERFIETGGVSEIDRLRRNWLTSVKPLGDFNRTSRKLENIFNNIASSSKRRRPRWARTDWAHSREQWLEEGWKHDWRSQPREPAGLPFHIAGTWMPGRLSYPVAGSPLHVGKTTGRVKKARRKFRRRMRATGKRLASGVIMSSWGKSDAD